MTYYQATEAILYSYSKIERYIRDLETKIKEIEKDEWSNIKSMQYDKIMVKVFGIARITEDTVLAKLELVEEIKKEIVKNKKFIRDIENIINELTKEEKQLIKILYLKNTDKEKAMRILNLKKDKFYRTKNSAVKEFSVAWFGVKALTENEEKG